MSWWSGGGRTCAPRMRRTRNGCVWSPRSVTMALSISRAAKADGAAFTASTLFIGATRTPKLRQATRRCHAEAAHYSATVRSTGALNMVKVDRLRQWLVTNGQSAHTTSTSSTALSRPPRTRNPSSYISRNIRIYSPALSSADMGAGCAPQLRFGSRYVAAFLVAEADSLGIRWTAIELESPRARPLPADGEWLKVQRIPNASHWSRCSETE
jgi:hypothetical protein